MEITKIHRNFIEISVKDTGIGLKLEDLDRILNHFEQVNGSCSRSYQNTVLGLSLSKSLLEIHSGQIRAQSNR